MSRVKRGVTSHARHKKSLIKPKVIMDVVKIPLKLPSRLLPRRGNMPIVIDVSASAIFVASGFSG